MRVPLVVLTSAVVAALTAAASGMFVNYPEAPVDRLLTNVTKAVEKSPDDPHLLYLAGRTHALAYAQGEAAKGHRMWKEVDPAELPVFSTRNYDRLSFAGTLDEARTGHLREGIRLLRRAAALAKEPLGPRTSDDRPLLHVGLGWLLDDGSRYAPKLGHPEGAEPKQDLSAEECAAIDARIAALVSEDAETSAAARTELRKSLPRCWSRLVAKKDAEDEGLRAKVGALLTRWWQDQALDAYRRAYELTLDDDPKRQVDGTWEIPHETGRAILRLLDDPIDPAAAKKEAKRVAARVKEFDQWDGMAVTPIVFPVDGAAPLADLLPVGRTARFDLVGDGIPRRWPWPSADAAFLVWAPEAAERADAVVDSGRRLFGSRTWWIFWRDGYEPLSMLDDDGDGRLSGAELDGVAVWRDLDGDGGSDPGEVVSAVTYGVSWIAVRATRAEDGVPAADLGIGLVDGTTRPTYDWTPTSLPEPPPDAAPAQ